MKNMKNQQTIFILQEISYRRRLKIRSKRFNFEISELIWRFMSNQASMLCLSSNKPELKQLLHTLFILMTSWLISECCLWTEAHFTFHSQWWVTTKIREKCCRDPPARPHVTLNLLFVSLSLEFHHVKMWQEEVDGHGVLLSARFVTRQLTVSPNHAVRPTRLAVQTLHMKKSKLFPLKFDDRNHIWAL